MAYLMRFFSFLFLSVSFIALPNLTFGQNNASAPPIVQADDDNGGNGKQFGDDGIDYNPYYIDQLTEIGDCYIFNNPSTPIPFNFYINLLGGNSLPGDILGVDVTIYGYDQNNQTGIFLGTLGTFTLQAYNGQLNFVNYSLNLFFGQSGNIANGNININNLGDSGINPNEFCFFRFKFKLKRYNPFGEFWEPVYSTIRSSVIMSTFPMANCHCATINPVPIPDKKSIKLQSFLSVYPNPFSNLLILESDEISNKISHIKLINLKGEVYMDIQQPNLNSDKLKIDVSTLPSGIYFMNVYHQNGVKNYKLVKL